MLTKLKSLDLSRNPLEDLHPDVFKDIIVSVCENEGDKERGGNKKCLLIFREKVSKINLKLHHLIIVTCCGVYHK